MTRVDYSSQLVAAESAARMAGAYLRSRFEEAEKQVDALFAHDVKLRLDRETQELIACELRKSFPGYSFLGEEGALTSPNSEAEWVVDPLDGTVNYFYGIPLFCVSIALRVNGKLVLGCVYDPMRDECFCALAGGVPVCNGRPIRVSSREKMADAVVFIGHGTHDGSGAEGMKRFAHLSPQVRKIRILGTAALTLCYIAAGRFDAYVENRIHLWDMAAARVILEAAGGVLEFSPVDEKGLTGSVLAWNGKIPLHQALECPPVSSLSSSSAPASPSPSC